MFVDKPLENHCATQISVKFDWWEICNGKIVEVMWTPEVATVLFDRDLQPIWL